MPVTQQHNSTDTIPGAAPNTEPPRIGTGYGHPEYHFVQGLMELRSAMHQMDTDNKVNAATMATKIDQMQSTLESTKKKVDDLVKWKFMILGGVAVISFISGLLFKFGDRITFTDPQQAPTQATAQPSQPTKSGK